MSLKTESGLQYGISKFFWKIRENMLYSDIQDIERGISILSKKEGFGDKFNNLIYRVEMNTSYSIEENIEIMKLLIKQIYN